MSHPPVFVDKTGKVRRMMPKRAVLDVYNICLGGSFASLFLACLAANEVEATKQHEGSYYIHISCLFLSPSPSELTHFSLSRRGDAPADATQT